ncbi:MAG: gluconokinase [Ginsengibacter sp.]
MSDIIYIMGVAGSGKTTIGKLLSLQTGSPFFDADDLHPASNKEKMKAGNPLDDKDRQQWLYTLNLLAIEQSKFKGTIIACSGLKNKYRDILATGISKPTWIFLEGSYEIIYERMQKRKDHFMPPGLLRSQFENLEVPEDAFMVDINNNPAKIVEMIMQHLLKKNQS